MGPSSQQQLSGNRHNASVPTPFLSSYKIIFPLLLIWIRLSTAAATSPPPIEAPRHLCPMPAHFFTLLTDILKWGKGKYRKAPFSKIQYIHIFWLQIKGPRQVVVVAPNSALTWRDAICQCTAQCVFIRVRGPPSPTQSAVHLKSINAMNPN